MSQEKLSIARVYKTKIVNKFNYDNDDDIIDNFVNNKAN